MIAIDPGACTGWAHFDDEVESDPKLVELSSCGLLDLTKKDPFIPRSGPLSWDYSHLVIEDQVIYPRMKEDPNDIIELAKKAGRVFQALCRQRYTWVEPRKWKGTLAKDTMAVRILEALNVSERRVYFAAADKVPEGVRHNIIDAIGIGLWKLGRLGRQNLTRARARGTKGKR